MTNVSSSTKNLFKPFYRTDFYEKNSIVSSAIKRTGIKHMLGVSHLNLCTQTKSKTYLKKDASTNTNNPINILRKLSIFWMFWYPCMEIFLIFKLLSYRTDPPILALLYRICLLN